MAFLKFDTFIANKLGVDAAVLLYHYYNQWIIELEENLGKPLDRELQTNTEELLAEIDYMSKYQIRIANTILQDSGLIAILFCQDKVYYDFTDNQLSELKGIWGEGI